MEQSKRKQIEVEFRALLDENEYSSLIHTLNVKAKDLGEDDKIIHFFIFPDKLLKVTNNLTQNSAKITLKLNRIGNGSMFEELEVPIAQTEVDKMARIFQTFDFEYLLEPIVRRHNYLYKGVELAVKYSASWQHHVELEIVIDDEADHAKAEQTIREIAKELSLRLMTEGELASFTKNIEETYKLQSRQATAN